ncbi:hypothetical protein H5410_002824 [Solanum commersonii]|uniref:Uncharacterized protein n=1 Tax=Solanum commersonii TaxID=4109 RepID=A0A9J6B3B9_SOLCO|nr:hypothetical protein H5410_002824 [Solanum commersonii]
MVGLFLIALLDSDVEFLIYALQYLEREECEYYSKALRLLHGKPLLNFDCISLWEWKQHKLFKKVDGKFTSNLDKVNNKYYLEPASLQEMV